MRIVLDQDQILCRWTERIVEYWNEDNGTSLTRDDIKSWDVGESLGPGGRYFMRSMCRYPEFYRDLDPVEGAIEGVRKLVSAGHDVLIVSAVPWHATTAFTGKVEWLRRNMPFFPIDNFAAFHRKELMPGDVLFDDGLHNIEAWHKTGRLVVCMDHSWNATDDSRLHNMRRVKHWNEFLAAVKDIERGVWYAQPV